MFTSIKMTTSDVFFITDHFLGKCLATSIYIVLYNFIFIIYFFAMWPIVPRYCLQTPCMLQYSLSPKTIFFLFRLQFISTLKLGAQDLDRQMHCGIVLNGKIRFP